MPVTFVPACERCLFAGSMYRGWLYFPYLAEETSIGKRSKREFGVVGEKKGKEGWIFWEEEEIELIQRINRRRFNENLKIFPFGFHRLRFVKERNMADSRDSILHVAK